MTSGSTLLSRSWNAEYVVYDTASGDTHLLGEAAVQVLAALQVNPMNTRAVCDTVSQYCSIGEQADVTVLTDTILADLASLRLIERSYL